MQGFKKILGFVVAFCSIAAFADLSFAQSRTKTDEIVSSSGGPVYFPSGITLSTDDDTYSATLTAGTNVAAVVTPVTLKRVKVGKYEHVFGQVSIDPTAGSTLSVFTLSLPNRAANFSGTLGAVGVAGLPAAATAGNCAATNNAKTVSCTYTSGGTAVELVNVSFWYATSGN
jgi:hypothetical protein